MAELTREDLRKTLDILDEMWPEHSGVVTLARTLAASLLTDSERLEAEQKAHEETRLLLGLYSGGKAGTVPEGWAFGAELTVPRTPFMFARTPDRGALVSVYADGRWVTSFLRGGGVGEDHPGPRPIATAIAEAEAWLESRAKEGA